MTKSLASALLLSVLFILPAHAGADEAAKVPLSVLYLTRNDSPNRTSSFVDYLSRHFAHCVSASRDEFNPALIDDVDVVMLDWSQDERRGNRSESPVGPLEEWSKPTVLLGSAGLLMAEAWQVIGDAG